MLTPDSIREQIVRIQVELRTIPESLEDLEMRAERAELDAARVVDVSFMSHNGNIEERKAQSRIDALFVKDDAVVHRAAYNRARLKVRLLEIELTSLQSLLKSVQAEL